jgi:hypothetical protein
MSKLAQLGILLIVSGCVSFLMGIFPFVAGLIDMPGLGLAQISAIVGGLFFVISGAYIVAYTLIHRWHVNTMMQNVGIRLGLTGLIFAGAASLADILGFGTHSGSSNQIMGWLQAAGILAGFLIAAAGVTLYAYAPHK